MSGDFKFMNDFYQKIDSDTGEVLTLRPISHELSKIVRDEDFNRNSRFYLLGKAQQLLNDDFRVFYCMKHAFSDVKVLFSPQYQRCHFTGLATCGSIWVCPVCSAKICSRRASDLKKVIDFHESYGGFLYMVTLTVPHNLSYSLSEMIAKFQSSLTSFHSSYFYKKFVNSLDFLGHVRSLEINFSPKNGWHVHTHSLYFFPTQIDFVYFQQQLLQIWKKSVLASGLSEPNHRGVDVRPASSGGGDYLAKWGAHNELVGSFLKQAKFSSFSPFQMLTMPEYSHRFVEYARSTTSSRHGISKGLNFLSFSRSLNKYLKNNGFKSIDRDDEEIASENSAISSQVLDLSFDDYDFLKKKISLPRFWPRQNLVH